MALDDDPEVVRFTNDGRPTPRDDIEQRILPGWLRCYEESPGFGFWAVEERGTDEFIGWFHLRPRPGHPPVEPELGYRLRRSAWGKGYATEGGRALIHRGFTEHPLERVLARTLVVNIASRRVMEKCGLRPVRFFRQDWSERVSGDERGLVEYALDRQDWERLAAAEHPASVHRDGLG